MITTIKEFRKLNERLDIDKLVVPKNNFDLKQIIQDNIKEYGKNCNLNFIDVSNITDMSKLFYKSNFNGHIDEWNTSKVTNMSGMFQDSNFNQDISNWNVSNVKNMNYMFAHSHFNQDISNWNISNVEDMEGMFGGIKSEFNQDISEWDISNVTNMFYMFYNNKAFDKNIDKWNLHTDCVTTDMFKNSKLEEDNKLPSWYIDLNFLLS